MRGPALVAHDRAAEFRDPVTAYGKRRRTACRTGDDDGDPDYRAPSPGDRERDSAFPNGLPDSSGSSGGSSGKGGGWNCARTRWC
ncbi:hypothetical protein [Streptomyces sp. KMM 9044]|uniref:hypothetical protein n=1 Tax=Streptomyces sp. KMM 9044 TaxID=2744474 RepID=UPI0022B24928|nr:hypothetical protein [Streptomyces sp. KMM 9044]WAX77375.1 hypothetical protein HUV60_006580 [Streptomyces sp. KMM 9044]